MLVITALFAAALVLTSSKSLGSALSLCHEADLAALLDFKASLTDNSSNLRSWDANASCCEWVGITCGHSSPARVVGISLHGMGLVGNLSQALGNISSLEILDLSHNALSGHIPNELTSLSRLRQLDLSNNNLSGELSVLTSLEGLQEISISSNGFFGRFPSLSNSGSLLRFWASNNHLTGEVPFHICRNARYVEVLDLSYNWLGGSLAEGLGVCTHLQELDLGGNRLQGQIPMDIYNLSALTRLSLGDNGLTGILDRAVGGLANLQHLMLGFNGFIGPLPANLSACTKLKLFSATYNSFEGSLDLIQFNKLHMLEILDLSDNFFQGMIPSSLAGCAALQGLSMAKNNFTGAIPMELSSLKNLSTLALWSNILNGSMRPFVGSKHLVSILLTKNFFEETIPETVEGEGLSSLQALALGNLHLRGRIPKWLKNCTKLQVLDLSCNRLEGPIPSWLGLFRRLFYVDLSNNSFSGYVPAELFGLPTLMQYGEKNLTGLQAVNDIFDLQQVFQGLLYVHGLVLRPSMFLSHNRLQGPIPLQVGALKALINLNLSFNNLSGSIPETMGSMIQLEVLDLSSNKLSGSIPSSLSKMSFLASLNVSHNQLVGMIPQGGQLLTFAKESYEGNADLCGLPLSIACLNNETSSTVPASFSKSPGSSILVPVCVAVGFIVFAICLVLLETFKKK